jgi:hypothetical protein
LRRECPTFHYFEGWDAIFEGSAAGDSLSETNPRMTVDQELDQLLRTAIQTKHLVRFKYKGQERVAEPHDYGIQKGIVRLFCYQVGGQSGSRLPGWRLVDVCGMRDGEMLKRRFAGTRQDSSSKHHEWDEVFIRVT